MDRLFCTADVHPRDRLAYWQDVACKTFVEIDCRTTAGPRFDATIWSGALADISIALVQTDQCDVTRTTRHVARAGSDEVLLSLQLEGSCSLSQSGRSISLAAGDFAIYDTLRCYELAVSSGVRQLVFKLPRRSLEQRLGCLSKYVARAVRGADPLGGFASAFLDLIPARANLMAQLDAQVAHEFSDQVLDLVTMAFRSAIDAEAASRSSSAEITLARLKAAVERLLHDPTLNPSMAAAAAGVSIRHANELLGREGFALERYICEQRLIGSAKALADPLQNGRRIGEIAFSWGFADASHFARRFKDRHGLAPRDYRAAMGQRPS